MSLSYGHLPLPAEVASRSENPPCTLREVEAFATEPRPIILGVRCSRGWTRTSVLRIMSPTSCPLLYPAEDEHSSAPHGLGQAPQPHSGQVAGHTEVSIHRLHPGHEKTIVVCATGFSLIRFIASLMSSAVSSSLMVSPDGKLRLGEEAPLSNRDHPTR